VVSKVVDDEDHKPRGSLISYGSLCLDFLQATRALSVGDQDSRQDLSHWIFERGLTERPVPVETHVLPQVTALREAIWVCVRAAMAQGEFPGSERDRINRWAMVHAYPQLEPAGTLTWHAHRPIEGALVRIARDAVELLSGEARSRIRRCPGCDAVFVDRSPSGRATWCSIAICGNRAKVAAYRGRTRAIRRRRGSGRRG
jgi:predicted RNA-binding Zn ribbon-like protein